tara:strand:+ start:1035 stop:1466 length:432 start_codon:yes stop_codon:yes gene_type:complete
MFNFFKKNNKEDKNDQSGFELELTASVLAYELARSDGEIDDNELAILMKEVELISEKVGKDKNEIFKIIETYSKDSVSFYDFIKDINNYYSKVEKLNLLQFMWKIAYSDSRLDVDEERLIRRMADMIKIKDVEVLKLKDLEKN